MMDKVYKSCEPLCCGKDLLRSDNSLATIETIKTECSKDCFCKSVCYDILRLLKDSQRPEAVDLISHTKVYHG